MSPRAPQRPVFSPPSVAPSPGIDPPAEPKAWIRRAAATARNEPINKEPSLKEPRADFPPISAPRSEQVARTYAPERTRDMPRDTGKPAGKDAGLFDVVWPDARSKAAPGDEPAPREPVQREQRSEPVLPQRPREEPRAEQRAEPAAAPERPAAILKSGVIDGMAYTLYADGSIEAELPQGIVRFAWSMRSARIWRKASDALANARKRERRRPAAGVLLFADRSACLRQGQRSAVHAIALTGRPRTIRNTWPRCARISRIALRCGA